MQEAAARAQYQKDQSNLQAFQAKRQATVAIAQERLSLYGVSPGVAARVVMIVAIVQPFMFDRLLRGLRGQVHGLTCWEVRGFGIKATQASGNLDAADYQSQRTRWSCLPFQISSDLLDTLGR